MLDRLRSFDVDRMDMEEAVSLSAFGRALRTEYDVLQEMPPDWLDNRLKELRRMIRSRQQDSLEKRLREARLRLSHLRTPDEKRADVEREIASLEQQLITV